MYHVLRRSVVIVASSAVIVSGAPLLGTAFATSTLTQSSVTPTNGQTVADSHPTVNASYTDGGAAANLDPSSTITVTGGPTTVACDKAVSGNTITCNYPSTTLLKSGTYTITVHAVEASNTANTADSTSNFIVDVPAIKTAAPAVNGRVQSFNSVSVTYTNSIDDTHSTITVQQIADKTGNNTYTPASHTPLTGTTKFIDSSTGSPATLADMKTDSNQNDTIVFTPTSAPVNKGIYQVTLDVFGTDGKSNGLTTADGPNLAAHSHDTYTFTMDDPLPPPPAPTNLAESPNPVTSANLTAVTFTGNGTPGNTIVVDAFDGTTHFNNAGTANGGPVTVSTGPSTTSCAWAKEFNYTNSGLKDGTITWTATETAPQSSSAPANGPSFTKDVTPPTGSHVAGSFNPSNSTTMTVTGGSDATVDHYTLNIHDNTQPNVHTIPQITLTKAANGGVAADGTINYQVDVSSLDDGTIFLSLTAFDANGNSATAPSASATKNSGLQLLFDSTQTVFKLANSDTPTFDTVLARQDHAVQKLSQLAIEFSNPITFNRHATGTLNNTPSNNSGNLDIPATKPQFVEVLANGADGNTLQGTYAQDPNDSRRMLVTPPPGLADGTYKVFVNVFEGLGKCNWDADPMPPSTSPTPATPCPSYNDYINVPNSNPVTPFTFTVDSQPPSTPVISTLPSGTVDGSNVGDVLIRGTAAGATKVTLTARSSGGGPVLALNGGQPVAVGSDGTWQDEESNGTFAALADGTITISGTASDAATNTSPVGTDTVSLAARPSIPRSLAVPETSTSFTLRWQVPSYDGYPAVNGTSTSHLTGYRYTYQDTTSGAVDTAVHTVSVNNAAATSVTQGSLFTGHSYAVTLCALNNINPSGPCNTIRTTAIPAFVTSLTEAASHSIVVYGNPVTLSGRLTRHDIGAGLSGQPVTIQPRYDNGTTGTVIHLTTNSTGNWSVTITKPAKNAYYVAAFNTTHANRLYQSASASVRVLVKVSLRIDKVSARSSSHTVPVTVSGHITPNQSGRSVLIYARAAGSRYYQRIGYAKISSTSTWSYVHTFGRGTYYLFASFPSQNGNVGGNSQVVTITRS
jgi:hypothetical protein